MDGSQGKGSEQTGNVGLEECPELGRGGGGLFKCCKLRGHGDSHHFTIPVPAERLCGKQLMCLSSYLTCMLPLGHLGQHSNGKYAWPDYVNKRCGHVRDGFIGLFCNLAKGHPGDHYYVHLCLNVEDNGRFVAKCDRACKHLGPHMSSDGQGNYFEWPQAAVLYSYRFGALHPPIQPYYESVEEVTKMVNSYEYHPGGDLLKIEGPKVTVLSKFPRKYVIDEDDDEEPACDSPLSHPAKSVELAFWEQACLKWGIKKADEMLLERRKRL